MMMIIKKMMKVTMVINFFACVDSVAVKDTGRRDVLERIDWFSDKRFQLSDLYEWCWPALARLWMNKIDPVV